MHNFKNPTRIIYGKGSFSRLEWVLEAFAPEKALVVVGGKSMEREGYLGKLKGCLDCETVLHHVSHEPSVKVIEEGVSKSKDTDVVVGLGGGSVLDAAKAIAILLKNDVRLNDVLNSKAKLSKPGVPLIAVPSTSGTGSEVTRVSVVGDTGENFKQSFRTEDMYPHTAVVDPELTLSCPSNVTASAGLDALSHALESFTTKSPTPITSPLAFRAMELIHKNLLKAFEDGSDIEAREGMSYASLLAGLAISNSGLGMVHGIAHAL
ncbi:MAG TPA: iron-containing alcohol dehydrogenase, partial [Candidatus Altiarchaeales archaeon]|nr:iron-containing alcohol dehydrogenase [Candidatus Altiarchaeales archaeon]